MHGFRNSLLGALAVALLAVVGCQDGNPISGPAGNPAVIAPSASTGTTEGSTWRIIEESNTEVGGVSAMIGAEGGQLRLGQHRLVVPAGAVDAPTEFRMKKNGGKLRVSLSATRTTHNDVGAAGFATPVYLSLSYGNAASLPADLSNLAIVWIRSDGAIEAQHTTVDTAAKTVTGELGHFSDYAMATK